MAQYAMLVYAPTAPDDVQPDPEADAAHQRYATELRESGAMVAAFRLQNSGTATSIRADAISDGPFLDAKEVIAGFCILEAPDLDAALELARANPVAQQGGGVEVRPVENGTIPSPAAT